MKPGALTSRFALAAAIITALNSVISHVHMPDTPLSVITNPQQCWQTAGKAG